MSNKKKVDLIAYFLKSAPTTQYRSFTQVFQADDPAKQIPKDIQSDSDYLYHFLNKLELFGLSNANFVTERDRRRQITPQFRKIIPSMLVTKKTTSGSQQESEQLAESIKLVSTYSGYGTIPFQQLEQRLQIASPAAIGEVRTKLIYLFKMLINKRDRIAPDSLQLEANLQLSMAIINALSRTQQGEHKENWKQLEAMQKLLRAREYHKKGLRSIALSNFEEIFRDEAASAKTRLEALKVICSSGEQLGDPKTLESLMSEMQARGEKEYEEIILSSIRRIKGVKQ